MSAWAWTLVFDRCSGNEIAPIGWVGQKAMGLKPASDSRIKPPTRVFQLLESLKALFGAPSFSCYYLHGLLAPLCVTETIARNIASPYYRGTSFIDSQPSVKMLRSPHQARKAGQCTKGWAMHLWVSLICVPSSPWT
jgi:hypothetical protein